MNKERKKALETINDELQAIKERIEDLRTQEEDALQNLPENLQSSEQAAKMDLAIDDMQDAITSIEDISENLLLIVNS